MAMKKPEARSIPISRSLIPWVLAILLPSGISMGDQAGWLQVESWRGKFWLEHTRDLAGRQMFGFSTTGWIKNSAQGSFTFDRKTDAETWTGRGSATWDVDEYQKLCDAQVMPCGETTSKGGGTVPLGVDSELWIDVRGGTYELMIEPGGAYLEGMEVDHVVTHVGTTTTERQRAPVDTHAYAEGFHGYFENDFDLPRQGLTLCGREVRSDGTVFRWKLWPADGPEPACSQVEGG